MSEKQIIEGVDPLSTGETTYETQPNEVVETTLVFEELETAPAVKTTAPKKRRAAKKKKR